jgi:dipeptidyl-peptidase 4
VYRSIAVLTLACCAWAADLGKKPITLEALAGRQAPPALGEPVWASDGKCFVYTEGSKLLLYDVASRSKRELVSLDAVAAAATAVPPADRSGWEDRDVKEETVQWLPSGKQLLLSAGGDLFLFRVEVGGWTQLTATPVAERDPKVSPDGSRVSFRRGHDLYVMEIASRKITRLTDDGSPTRLNAELDWVYPEELDLATAYWWSPDSKSIAYLQFDVSREPLYPQADLTRLPAVFEPERFPKAGDPNADVLLGVVAATGGRTRWMNLGETRDALLARFAWLPDSSGIAVQRLNRIQNRLDLLIADARTGNTRSALRETDPYWINVHGDPRFLKDGKEFLWESERGGFDHLYRYSINGKEIAQLTHGDWEVDSVAGVDEAAGEVYYVSTEAGPLERQFYSVSFDGTKRRLTADAGTHSISMSPNCETYLDTFSSLTSPTRRSLHRRDGSELALLDDSGRAVLDEYDLLTAEIVQVQASDGAMLFGRLIRPSGFDPHKKYPAIVEVYGGPHVQRVENRWYDALSIEQVLARRGYVVWSMDGRGSSGRGHQWESAVFRNLGAKELEDQKEGVRYLLSLGFVDTARVGIHGWSYGGFMTLYSILHAPDVFACGVAGAPVTDWRDYDTIYTERYMGLPSENVAPYDRSSVVAAAAELERPLLIVHNIEDDNVLFQNTVRMAEALERANKQFELMVYPNKSHHLSIGREHFDRLLVDFFDRNLKTR